MHLRFAAAVRFALWVLAATPVRAEDPVIGFKSDDPDMNAAIAKARGGLPGFWVKFKSPGEGEDSFALKIAITLWLSPRFKPL